MGARITAREGLIFYWGTQHATGEYRRAIDILNFIPQMAAAMRPFAVSTAARCPITLFYTADFSACSWDVICNGTAGNRSLTRQNRVF